MTAQVAPNAVAAVKAARHWDRLMAMAAFGGFTDADGHPGVNRPACSAEDIAARRLLIAWGAELGLAASVDAQGNLFLRQEGTEPGLAPVMTGSHMDSQPNGGRFDGIWGVHRRAGGGPGAARRRRGAAPPDRDRRLDQRGRRPLRPGLHGQHGLCRLQPARHLGRRHRQRRHALRRRARQACWRARPTSRAGPRASRKAGRALRLCRGHIEQGPRLESAGLDIGVVTGIQGSRWFLVEIVGRTDHAGTTPLQLRRDAVQDMVRAINALNALMHDPADVLRFTVGRIEVSPNAGNTVADRVRFTIDCRHPDGAELDRRADAIAATVGEAMLTCTAT